MAAMTRNEILEALKRFQQAKQSEYHITRIGVFGSAARNETHETSDVDVVVEVDVPDLFILIGIKQDLEEILGRPVDVVRYRDQMNAFLKERIELEAIYV
jgi:predicted nucleotidyltransferase